MLTIVLGTLAVGYAGLCAFFFATQRSVIYPAPPTRALPTGKAKLLDVPGGTPLLWRDAGIDGPVVVHFHGNGEQVGHLGWLAEGFAVRGISFAAVEYPGYPGAAGSPSEDALLDAAQKALEYLTTKLGVAKSRLVLLGQSLGSGVATAMAEKGWGTRMVLLTPYTSLADVGARVLPYVPVRLLILDRFDSAGRAPRVTLPVLVVHGTKDEVIPFDLGAKLAGLFPSARFMKVEGGQHNDLWERKDVSDAVMAFVQGTPPP